MLSRSCRSRAAAALAAASLFFLPALQSFPLPARGGAEEAKAAAVSQDPPPRFMEQAGNGRRQGSRVLPTLVGLALVGAVVAVLVLTVFRQNGYNPHIIPLEFIKGVSNPYFPVIAGRDMNYAVTAGGETVALTAAATANTKLIMGVLCLGVQDRVATAEWLLEDTWRWYAEDQNGDVWYFAGETRKYDHEAVTEDWSWQAGLDGAKPGKVMLGKPQDFLNREFWQAYAPGRSEEKAQVLGVHETVTVPCGTFGGCVKLKVYSDLEPDRFEYRYYAAGVGLVLSESVPADLRRVELISISSN